MVHTNLVRGLLDLKSFKASEVSESCQCGKDHRILFDRSLCKCKAPLKRSHNDLYDPIRTSSYFGYHYILVFIDDFTRYIYLGLLDETEVKIIYKILRI